MTEKTTDRLARLQERKAALERQIAAAERQAKASARKWDTRRKIILGGAVLAAIETDPAVRQRVRALLAERVTRPNDRATIADLLADPTPPVL